MSERESEQLSTEPLRAYLANRDASCPVCEYNLRGLSGVACPECGMPLALQIPAVIETTQPPTVAERGEHLRGTLKGVLVVLFLLALATFVSPQVMYWPVLFAMPGAILVACVFWLISLRLRRRYERLSGRGGVRPARLAGSVASLRGLALLAILALLLEGALLAVRHTQWFVRMVPHLFSAARWRPTTLQKATWCLAALALVVLTVSGLVSTAMLLMARDHRARANAVKFAVKVLCAAWIAYAALHATFRGA